MYIHKETCQRQKWLTIKLWVKKDTIPIRMYFNFVLRLKNKVLLKDSIYAGS